MSVDQAPQRPFVAFNLADGRYLVGCDAGGRRAASVRLPRGTVEQAVLEALLVELEMGADGRLLATTPCAAEPLAAANLFTLVVSALEANVAGRPTDPDQLRGLEAELELALSAVRVARRAGLGTSVGPNEPSSRTRAR
jgi:hypothetical protein